MQTAAILGAGELGATLARLLSERERARQVVLVDPDLGKAQGKALDLRQSGPVEGSDCAVVGAAGLPAEASALVIADPPELAVPAPDLKALADRLLAARPALLVAAGAHAAALLEIAVNRGFPRDRAVGSLPVAYASAVARHLATDLEVEPKDVSALVLGLPPDRAVVPHAMASVHGIPAEALSPVALRRAAGLALLRPRGPVALAAAAARVLEALGGSRDTLLPVLAVLAGEYGQRGIALGVPARLCGGRLREVVELPLDPVERIALDNAARRR